MMGMGSLGFLFQVKYTALMALVLQNTLLVVFMRYSRVQEGPRYATSTAVVCMEVMKLVTCLGVIFFESGKDVRQWVATVRADTWDNPMEVVKIAVPSLLYTIQNNLLYYALSHLDTPTYMVGYQTKILTTAVFSALLLGRKLSRTQWMSLLLLTAGVSMAQLGGGKGDPNKGENTFGGFVAVLAAACTSGFAGVYFEKMLKGAKTSIWMRNVQICCTSIGLGLVTIWASGDGETVYNHGFFYGYNYVVWSVVFLQAVGGLVVAVVVKYADNILKGFAASFSIITSCILCIFIFDWRPTFTFLCGAVLVMVSMKMYSHVPTPKENAAMKNEKNEGPEPEVEQSKV